jgi:predicted site-specific integrase-resolvase
MKLSKYAKITGVCYETALNHYHGKLIRGAYQLANGTIIVPDDFNAELVKKNNIIKEEVVLYARVSTSQQKDDLERQIQRLKDYASAKGYIVYKSITEIASGLNDNRPKLLEILKNKNYGILVVEHKDRLTRFGFNFISCLFEEQNRKIEIINQEENKNDLMQDFISVITSFCARIYGQRRSQKKLKTVLDAINQDNNDEESS